jgi:hypothetical protein
MTRRAALTTLSILAALSLSACDEGEVTCDDLSCDPDAELCVFSGSDTDDPGRAECHPLPEPCAAGLACSCLEGQEVGGASMDFCLADGSCEVVDGVLTVSCPGG